MNKVKIGKFFIYVFLVLLALFCIAPFMIMIVNGTRSTAQIQSGISLLPGNALRDNMQSIMEKNVNMLRAFGNSLVVALSGSLLAAFFSALTAYGFSVYAFKGKKFFMSIVIALLLMPPQINIVGFFELCTKLHIVDSYLPLILPSVATASTVFFLIQYVPGVLPMELIECARIEGAGEMYIFCKIGLPLILPGVATMSIFNFVAQWNNYLTPLIILNDERKYTLPLVISKLKGYGFQQDLGAQYLAIAFSVIPILIAYIVFSKFIISGVSAGAVKE